MLFRSQRGDTLSGIAQRFGTTVARLASLNNIRNTCLLYTSLLRRGLDPQVFAREVAEHLRALLLAQTVGEAAEELLECTPEEDVYKRQVPWVLYLYIEVPFQGRQYVQLYARRQKMSSASPPGLTGRGKVGILNKTGA